MILRMRLRRYDFKIHSEKKYGENTLCPFWQKCDEMFEHIFHCPDGLTYAYGTYGTKSLHKIGRYLIEYDKFSELIVLGGNDCKFQNL